MYSKKGPKFSSQIWKTHQDTIATVIQCMMKFELILFIKKYD